VTGLVTAEDGRRLGLQLTVFKVGLLPGPPPFDSAWASGEAVMAHLAVTEPAAGRHRFSEVLWRAGPLAGLGSPPGPLVAWARAPPGTPGAWRLLLEGDAWQMEARDDAAAVALSLTARPLKPVVLQGPNGYSAKAAAPGYASEYYSQTRLALEGTVTLDGQPLRVGGEGWLDREVSSAALAPAQVGWDWFALRLADGRDLVLYLMRRADGAVDFASGALVSPGGRRSALGAGAFGVTPTARWRSPATGAEYPVAWTVEVPGAGLRLEVRAEVDAAENRSRLVPGLDYWEGPVEVRGGPGGRRLGEGYVEQVGRGPRSRPPL
jgi:predicted secreted hydrolase